jgi:uncharacterized membrane protein
VEIALLVVLALAIPVCAVWGFVLALGLRTKTRLLEERLARVEAQFRAGGPLPAAEAAPETEAPPAPVSTEQPAVAEPAPPAAEAPAQTPPEGLAEAPPELPPAAVPPAAPAQPRPGLEEALGTRWAVWVGGVALALGGLFLVRYSIEQGLLGPGARIAAGALFALALIAAGEWMRRREIASPFEAIPSAHVPGALTAAGTSTAFATVYAA